mgnify:CR=1 FL=1
MRLPIPRINRTQNGHEPAAQLSPEEIRYRTDIANALNHMNRHTRSLPRSERNLLRKAYEYAAAAHDGVKRKSGEPYITHPLAVARILYEEMGLIDVTSLACALLHDVVEDTETTLDDIEREFNPTIRQIIDGLTKIAGAGSVSQQNGLESVQAENFRKVLLTIADDIRVVLIKLGDRLHNMRTLGAQAPHKKFKIASETLYIYAPLAHRLGLYEIKTELEDLAFEHSQPQTYETLASKLEATKEEASEYIAQFIDSVDKVLKPTGLKYEIRSRFKSIYSIYMKMLRKAETFEEIYDKYAIRIILETREGKERDDCWNVYSAVSGLYKPNPKRLRDWISFPKGNGYESLHTTLLGPGNHWVEVQIRTTRMHEIAEKGIAAHWKYKESGELLEESLTDWIAQVREILANPSADALEAVRSFKENLQPNDVYVFTPKGEMMRLPVGATVLDFAYKIHTDVGNTAIGAQVGSEVVNVDYQLRPGDMVEVLTSRKGAPKREWLLYARTPRARDQIRTYLRRERNRLVERGRNLFHWRARQYGVDENHPYMKELLAFFLKPTKDEFYYALATHSIDTAKVQEFINLKKEGREISSEYVEAWEAKLREMNHRLEEAGVDPDMLILGKDQRIDSYRRAKCCNPVPGDDIMGFDIEDQVEIHRVQCPKAIQMMTQFGSRIIKARWAKDQEAVAFLTAVKVVGVDRQGMLLDILRVITSRMRLNIRKVSIESMGGLFEGIFHIYVSDLKELDHVIKQLKQNSHVHSVNRLENEADAAEAAEVDG